MPPIKAKNYQCKMCFQGSETKNLGNSRQFVTIFEVSRLKIRQCNCTTLHISKWHQCIIEFGITCYAKMNDPMTNFAELLFMYVCNYVTAKMCAKTFSFVEYKIKWMGSNLD